MCHLREAAGHLPGLLREDPEWREAVLRAGLLYDGGWQGKGAGKPSACWGLTRLMGGYPPSRGSSPQFALFSDGARSFGNVSDRGVPPHLF